VQNFEMLQNLKMSFDPLKRFLKKKIQKIHQTNKERMFFFEFATFRLYGPIGN
jgi:hypothetical protein